MTTFSVIGCFTSDGRTRKSLATFRIRHCGTIVLVGAFFSELSISEERGYKIHNLGVAITRTLDIIGRNMLTRAKNIKSTVMIK